MAKKTILNSVGTDPNKILPMKYKWARKHYKDGVANNWTPDEVNMVLGALGEMPAKSVFNLILNLQGQVGPQMKPQPPADEGGDE